MVELLEHYSLQEILIFIVFLALAVKSLITFFDWGYTYIRKIFDKEYTKLNSKEELERRLHQGDTMIESLQKDQQVTDDVLCKLSDKIDMLIQSDKDAIKAYITKEHHHYCYQVGWIDDFNFDCIERRYQHYTEEGGNSFIQGFMDDLRALPKQPLQEGEKDVMSYK